MTLVAKPSLVGTLDDPGKDFLINDGVFGSVDEDRSATIRGIPEGAHLARNGFRGIIRLNAPQLLKIVLGKIAPLALDRKSVV